jgi:hypothetical protein
MRRVEWTRVTIRRLIRTLGAGATACVIGTGAPALAQDADIVGAWDVSVSTPQGQNTSAPLVLKKEGDKIVGTFSSPQGDQPVEADVTDKTVTIWFSVRTQNGPVSITMKGTADAGVMKGTMDFGDRGQGQWSAKRVAAGAPASQAAETRPDVNGTWVFEVESAAGSGTPTMTFKQEGETLTGRYSGQLGEAPLTGSVKGNAVQFSFDVTVEANQLHIAYSGTVEKDSMKGTVNLGGLGEGTFTAKKKS